MIPGINKYEKWLGISIEELKGKLVLDIGSGPEEIFSKEAKREGVDVVSLSPELKHEDIREITKGNFLDIFRKGRWQKKSVAGIVQELPFENETFDVEVSLYGGMHYLPYLESEYRLAFKEIIRTLKSGGKAYLYPVNVQEEDEEKFKTLLQELSISADIELVLVEKSDRTANNLYRIVILKN